MLVRGAIALASASVALASCCLQVIDGDELAGSTSSGGSNGAGTGAGLGTGAGPDSGISRCIGGFGVPGTVTTLAGGGDGGALGRGVVEAKASQVSFDNLSGVAIDSAGDIFVAAGTVEKIDCAGDISIYGNPNSATALAGIASDPVGNVYVADQGFSRILKFDPNGNVTTLAGATEFNQPEGVAADSRGNVFVADTGSNLIRKIDASGNVTTLAGDGDAGFKDGTGDLAQFNGPQGVAVDASGNLYVADTYNFSIRKIDASGNVTTLAGNGTQGFADGTGGRKGTAGFGGPWGIAVDASGSVFVADSERNRIREIDPEGNVTTLAGNGTMAYADGTVGPLGTAEFNSPCAVAVGARGEIYVADFGDGRIRMITP